MPNTINLSKAEYALSLLRVNLERLTTHIEVELEAPLLPSNTPEEKCYDEAYNDAYRDILNKLQHIQKLDRART